MKTEKEKWRASWSPKTYQDHECHEDQVHEEVAWTGEPCRMHLKLASVGVEEVRIHYQAEFRSGQDERSEYAP